MKKNYTHVTMILDRSGSMGHLQKDVIGAINKLIADQVKISKDLKEAGTPGTCTISIVQFDTQDRYEVLRDFVPVETVKPLTEAEYAPRGGTPLFDAIGLGIVDLGTKLNALKEEDRPDNVVFVIETDGEENESREYKDPTKLQAMVKEQTEKYKWNFVFLGANQDAIMGGARFGFAAATSAGYSHTSKGVSTSNSILSDKLGMLRNSGVSGQTLQAYTKEERDESMKTS